MPRQSLLLCVGTLLFLSSCNYGFVQPLCNESNRIDATPYLGVFKARWAANGEDLVDLPQSAQETNEITATSPGPGQLLLTPRENDEMEPVSFRLCKLDQMIIAEILDEDFATDSKTGAQRSAYSQSRIDLTADGYELSALSVNEEALSKLQIPAIAIEDDGDYLFDNSADTTPNSSRLAPDQIHTLLTQALTKSPATLSLTKMTPSISR